MHMFTFLWITLQLYIPKTPTFYHLLSTHMMVVRMYHGSPHVIIHHPYTCDDHMLHHLLPSVGLTQAHPKYLTIQKPYTVRRLDVLTLVNHLILSFTSNIAAAGCKY